MADKTKAPETVATTKPHDPDIQVDEGFEASSEPDAADRPVRLHPVLTDEQFADAKKKARTKIDKERLTAAMKAVEEEEIERLRVEEGLVSDGGPGGDMVSITIDLAEHSANIVINHRPYWHGQTYLVQRRVADTLREIMFRGWLHQNQIDGKNLTSFYQKKRSTVLSPVKGVTNAPIANA